MGVIVIALCLAVIAAAITAEAPQRAKRKQMKRDEERRKARARKAKAARRSRLLKRQLKKLQKRIRVHATGYATPAHKRTANRLHKQFLAKKREYEQAIKEANEKVA